MNPESTIWFVGGTIVPSLLVAWLATFAARRWAPRWGLIDRPNERKVHLTPTPMGGGIGIAIGVLLPFLLGQIALFMAINNPTIADLVPEFARPHLAGLLKQSAGLWVLLGGASILMIVGLIDDRRGLDWRLRISLQFAVAAFCVVTQGWNLTAYIDLPRLNWIIAMVLSTIWIVTLINSFNMLDNMDGLSAGVAAIAAALLATALLIAPDPVTNHPQLFVAGFLLVLAGSLLGFLWHNRPPARIFMGDAGSYFIGFCIAVATLLATYTSYDSQAPLAMLTPLCVMAVPLYDMITVIWIRVRSGQSPFHADKNHFSHRLVELGLTKTQAVLTIYLMTATCGLGALLLHRLDWGGTIVVFAMIACVLLLIAILETSARRKLNE